MRITFVIPEANRSGGVRVVAAHAERLQQRGHVVCVISIPPYEPTIRERVRELVKRGRWLPSPGRESHLDDLDIEHRVLDRRRPVESTDVPDADVIIATWWETAEWVCAMGPQKGAKVYLVQGDEAEFYPARDLESRRRVLETLRLPMHRIVVSQWLAELYRERGVDDMAIVRNGIDLEEFPCSKRGRRDVFTVGYIHALAELKGAAIAREAIRIARRSVELEVLAFGSERPAQVDLPERARFEHSPDRAAIPSLYAGADAWLFPSRSEGFGLPVIEAMACGTPVIACPVGIAPEAVSAGGGMLLERVDPELMAAAIVEMAKLSDTQWRAMSERAREIAEGYGWEQAGESFERELVRACAASAEAVPA